MKVPRYYAVRGTAFASTMDQFDREAEREGRCVKRRDRRVDISKQFKHNDKEIRNLFGRR